MSEMNFHCGVYDRRGPIVRIAYLVTALAWWIIRRIGPRGAARPIVLCYHGVTARQRDRFARQMTSIADRTIRLDQAARAARQRRPLICITFDDALANLVEHALPITSSLGIPAEIFAVSGNLGDEPRWAMSPKDPDRNECVMSAAQLREVAADELCTIGSHTVSHPRLTDLGDEAVKRGLIESRAALRAIAGRDIEDLALPHGDGNDRIIEAARACGYRRILTLDPSAPRCAIGIEVIGRMKMSPDAWPIEFALTVDGAYAWLPPLRRAIRRVLRRIHPARGANRSSASSTQAADWRNAA